LNLACFPLHRVITQLLQFVDTRRSTVQERQCISRPSPQKLRVRPTQTRVGTHLSRRAHTRSLQNRTRSNCTMQPTSQRGYPHLHASDWCQHVALERKSNKSRKKRNTRASPSFIKQLIIGEACKIDQVANLRSISTGRLRRCLKDTLHSSQQNCRFFADWQLVPVLLGR